MPLFLAVKVSLRVHSKVKQIKNVLISILRLAFHHSLESSLLVGGSFPKQQLVIKSVLFCTLEILNITIIIIIIIIIISVIIIIIIIIVLSGIF